MSHDYVLEKIGMYRNRRTRFTDLEKRFLDLIRSFVKKSISERDFAIVFCKIGYEFLELMKVKWSLMSIQKSWSVKRKKAFKGYKTWGKISCKTVLKEANVYGD